jgi:hypothetical protein
MKRLFSLAFGCLALVSAAGHAQDLANIVGTVTDSSGAVVANAKVVASNPERGVARSAQTNQDGDYSLARVPIGVYTITVEKGGYQKLALTGISLEVGQTLRVNLELKVGSVSEQVIISSSSARVETETGSVSHVVTGEQVGQLNLEARNFAALATLIPGAAPDGGGFDASNTGVLANATIAFNGVPGNFNNWEIDGTNNVDQGSGSNSLMMSPSVDSIAEFRVSTSNYSAEYGKSGGANIEVVTKSGTKQFHGDLFEFVRNEIFDANDWFLNQAGQSRQPLKRNNWGFTLGGPIFIPRHYNKDRNKTFFFVSEEWRSYREGTVINAAVPSSRERQGDFSECDPASSNYNNAVAADGLCVVPVDPSTNAPYPNDIVPVDPTAAALLDALVPSPNAGVAGYRKAPSLATSVREDMVKFDHNFNDKLRIFLRYTQDRDNQDFIPTLWSSANYATVLSKWSSPAKSTVLHITETIRPDLLNEVVVSYSADVNRVHNLTGFDSPAGSIDKPQGFAMKTIFPQNQNETKLPGIQFNAGVPFFTGESTGFEFDFIDPQTAIKDNLIWSIGRHSLKTGFYLLSNHINTTTNIGLSTQGFLQFGGGAISTGNALADMFTGMIAQYEEYGKVTNGQLVGGPGRGRWRQWDFEPYVQDDWRVTPRLTLNLGIRYFALTPFYDASNPTNDSVFVPAHYDAGKQAQLDGNGNLVPGSGATPLTYGNGLEQCGAGSIPKGCAPSYRGTISPRFGFSWDPLGSGRSAVRGGYALNWDSSNPLFAGAGFNGNPPTTADLSGFNVVGYENIGPGPLGPVSFSDIPTHRIWPEIQQFSLGVQRELAGNTILSVSYVGTIGHHLQETLNINQVPIGATTQFVPAFAGSAQPGCDSGGNCDVQTALINLVPKIFFSPYRGYTDIMMRSDSGNSNYNSLQSDLRLRALHGLTFEAAYTWAHTLDNIVTNGVDDSDLKRWYGTSSLNQAQVLTANWIYEMPFFAKSQFSAARYLFSGWQLGGIARFSTGPPIDFACNLNGYASGIGGPVVCNPEGALDVKKGTLVDPNLNLPTRSWFDPGVVRQVTFDQLPANRQAGMFGTMRRNPLRGPGRNNWDISLIRNFTFAHDKSTLQFRVETFNTFNHPQWSGINTSCGSESPDGAACAGNGFGEVTSAYQSRVIQLGLKEVF